MDESIITKDDGDGAKTCTRCGLTKSLEDFYPARNKAGMRRAHCKSCHYQGQRQKMLADPEYYKKVTDQRYAWAIKKLATDPIYKAAILARNREQQRIKRKTDPEWRKRASGYAFKAKVKRKYGLTLEQIEDMRQAQGNRCYVCDRAAAETGKNRLNVDHCHTTGVVRKLLCNHCNLALGLAGDDPDRLEALAGYLRSHKAA